MELKKLHTHIPRLAEIYCKYQTAVSKKLSLSSLSLKIFNHGNRLKNITQGKTTLTLTNYCNAMQWFTDNWPTTLPWPDDIIRPKLSQKKAIEDEKKIHLSISLPSDIVTNIIKDPVDTENTDSFLIECYSRKNSKKENNDK